MESLFPQVLFLGPYFGPLILRIGIALIFAWEAYSLSKGAIREKAHGLWALIIAVLLGAGLFAQLAALAGVVYVLTSLFAGMHMSQFVKKNMGFLALIILVVIFISGAGAFAFDLPY